MSNALEVLKRIVREEYKNIKDGVNIHPSGFRDYTPEEDSDFDEPHSTEKMESVTETIELIKIDNPKYKARLHQVKLAFKLAKVKLTSIKPIKARKGVVPKGHYDKSGDRLAPAWAITATDGKNTKSGEVIFQDGNDPGFYIDKDYMGLNPNNKNKIPRNIQRWMIGKKAHHSKGVNESTKRQYRNVYSKYYKTYEAFAREVMNLAKRVTKISGDRTDERVILKNFKKQVIPFAGLMRSWSRGRESNPHIDESVDESGILYRAGVKKYGKEGMRKIQQAAGKRKSHAEIGKIKDKYEKGKKESVIVEFSKYRLGGLLDTKLKKRLERTIKVIGGKVDAVGNDYVKFRIGDMALQKLPAVITKLDRNKNVWIGDKNSKNIWDRKRNINKLGEGLHPYKDFNQQDDKKEYDLNLGAFIDKYQKMMKFMKKYKEVPDKNKRAWALSVRKKVGKSRFNGLIDDWGQVVGYLKSFDSFRSKKDDYAWDIKGESIDEGFGSPELMGKKDLAEFEKTRQKNAEVLGYKLTGKSDIKPIKEKTKVTSNK